jgi:hypothetical protein
MFEPVEDNGALSNPRATVELSRLVELTRDLRARAEQSPLRSRLVPAKMPGVLETVSRVLEQAERPMRVSEIHVAASELAGRSLRRSSVKGVLAAYAVGGDRRFARARRGVYEMRC